jgi:predicted transcriptional regulator
MYSRRPTFVVGFHGCEKRIRDRIVSQKEEIRRSGNDYDWLGHGVYFWDNDCERALDFAKEQQRNGKINEPAVLGAYIDLGDCLDLINHHNLYSLKDVYQQLKLTNEMSGSPLPTNKISKTGDMLLRHLDCAVINLYHELRKKNGMAPYDSVRGVFWEGEDLYPGAGMKEKNHIQICVRNMDCIKGFFIPRKKEVNSFS